MEPAAAAILAEHWPGIPNLGDITAVDWSTVPPVDVICGGFPCQDLSTAGMRRGLRPGTRSGLWQHMAEAVHQLKPRIVVIENVRGIFSAEAHSDLERDCWCVGDTGDPALRALGAVLGDLSGLGFDARWGTVPASAAGAPHRRERVFIVAADPAREQFHGTGAQRRPVPQHSNRGLGDVPLTLLPTPVVNDMGARRNPQEWDAWTVAMRDRHGNGNGHGPSLSVEAQRHDGFGPYQAAVERWERVQGRPAPAPADNGRLNPVFVEWLMGLREGWVTHPSLGLTHRHQLKALGNGVVPQQALLALQLLGEAI
jgi:DNA (cytosine-5)-methyltransferase 1